MSVHRLFNDLFFSNLDRKEEDNDHHCIDGGLLSNHELCCACEKPANRKICRACNGGGGDSRDPIFLNCIACEGRGYFLPEEEC